MAATAFDTLKFARRLKAVGVPEAQAEAQAELMGEAFVINMDALVTKDYLEQCLDAGFARQHAHSDQKFAAMQKQLDEHFKQIDLTFAEIGGELKLLRWMLALIVITTVVPVLQGWFTRFVLGG